LNVDQSYNRYHRYTPSDIKSNPDEEQKDINKGSNTRIKISDNKRPSNIFNRPKKQSPPKKNKCHVIIIYSQ